jgi:site-specific recombinase XerD
MKRIKYKNTTNNINEIIRIPEYYKDNLKINKEDSFFIGTYVFLNDYLPNTLNRSPNTIISYRNCLRILKIFIEKTTGECFFNLKVKDATRNLMLLFLKSIDEGGCITATRNQRLAGLKTYAKFMIGINFELADFLYCNILSIPMATAIKPEVGWIKREALQCIFEQTPENSKGRRDKIIMMLMYETAARASEILDLKPANKNQALI